MLAIIATALYAYVAPLATSAPDAKCLALGESCDGADATRCCVGACINEGNSIGRVCKLFEVKTGSDGLHHGCKIGAGFGVCVKTGTCFGPGLRSAEEAGCGLHNDRGAQVTKEQFTCAGGALGFGARCDWKAHPATGCPSANISGCSFCGTNDGHFFTCREPMAQNENSMAICGGNGCCGRHSGIKYDACPSKSVEPDGCNCCNCPGGPYGCDCSSAVDAEAVAA